MRRRRRLTIAWTLFAAAWIVARSARAQADPRYAVDPYEPAERGSEWFANESLDLRGRVRPSAGYAVSLSRRAFTVPNPDGTRGPAPVDVLATLHLGASVVLVDRLRVSADLPLQVYVDGETVTSAAAVVPKAPRDGGFGDLRLGFDVRMFGQHRGPITGALGFQTWFPMGQRSQWMSDGTFRIRPRAMLAGEAGPLVWAAQLGVAARDRSQLTAAGAIGVRLQDPLVVGVELFASTEIDDAFAKRATPAEVLLGIHWLIDGSARLAGGFGPGLGDGRGSPEWRAIVALDWAPELPGSRTKKMGTGRGHGKPAPPPADGDHDGVPDGVDACPTVAGVATNDPRTNGCPPDEDGDGIDDLRDACPTIPGLATSDPKTNGCPDPDRDKDGILDEEDACPDEKGERDVDPRRNGCPKAVVRGDRIVIFDRLEFKGATAELVANAQNEALLTAILAAALKVPATMRLRIEGHTDDRLDPKIGGARAASVVKWLSEHGIEAARLSSDGPGAQRPIATNETEAGRAENRRIEIRLVP